MKKLMSLILLCSMTMGMIAADLGSADAEKCCNKPCNTCPTTTTCNSCSSCGCKTTLTQEEEAAGAQRCNCKPKPGRSEVGESADAEKCCNKPCNTCPTTTTCNSCSSCGCKTTLTQEEEAAGVARCNCGKPRPATKADMGTADAQGCNSCNTCPTTTCQKPCGNSCNSCGCKTTLTKDEEAAGEKRCACSKPVGGKPGTKALAKVTVAKAMKKNQQQ